MRPPGPATPADAAPPLRDTSALRDVISPAARLVCAYDGATWTEGPAWWDDRLVFSDVVGRRVLAWAKDGSVHTVVDPSEFANGHAVDTRDRLIQCEHGRRAISAVRADGHTQVLVDHFEHKRLNSPNDVIVARDGAIWFTDPIFGLNQPAQGYPQEPELDHTSVYRFDADSATITRMADPDGPNGLQFSPDESLLYVSQTPPDGVVEIAAFDHDPITHALTGRRRFATVPDGIPDGFHVDSRGWLWSSSAAGVIVFSSDGDVLGSIPVPDTVSNCTFDPSERQLFMTGSSYLWMLNLDGV